jgi:hypothetical protein
MRAEDLELDVFTQHAEQFYLACLFSAEEALQNESTLFTASSASTIIGGPKHSTMKLMPTQFE